MVETVNIQPTFSFWFLLIFWRSPIDSSRKHNGPHNEKTENKKKKTDNRSYEFCDEPSCFKVIFRQEGTSFSNNRYHKSRKKTTFIYGCVIPNKFQKIFTNLKWSES